MAEHAWAAEWNGQWLPILDSLQGLEDEIAGTAWIHECAFRGDLGWDSHSIDATYTEREDLRERLVISAPPTSGVLSLHVRYVDAERGAAEVLVAITVDRIQVSLKVSGSDSETVTRTFAQVRSAIEAHAVEWTPHDWRVARHEFEGAFRENRWTRFSAWVEKHPALVALVVGILGATVAVIAIVSG